MGRIGRKLSRRKHREARKTSLQVSIHELAPGVYDLVIPLPPQPSLKEAIAAALRIVDSY